MRRLWTNQILAQLQGDLLLFHDVITQNESLSINVAPHALHLILIGQGWLE